MTPPETSKALQENGIIAIIRGTFTPEQLLAAAETLLAGGITVLEVTLNTPNAPAGIAYLKRQLAGRALVGAGTVRTKTQVDLAIDAGAAFLIAPSLDAESIGRAHQRGRLLLPGVFTASEAQAAAQLGCSLVKLFPADALGPSYLKALRAPLNDIDFVPVGGISVHNLAAYVEAGACAFGVGNSLVANSNQALSELTERARQFVSALARARGGGSA